MSQKASKFTSSSTKNQESHPHKLGDRNVQIKMMQEFSRCVDGCFSVNKATAYACTKRIRKLLSFGHNAPIKQVIDSGVVPRIIQFLRWKETPKLQFEAMWVITNIVSSDKSEYTAKIIDDGGIPLLVDLLQSPYYELQEQAAWALGNIAGDGDTCKNALVAAGALFAFKQVCQQRFDAKKLPLFTKADKPKDGQTPPAEAQYIALMHILSWSLSNFCRYKEQQQANLAEILECLYHLLNSQDAQRLVLAADEKETDDIHGYGDSFGANIGWSFTYLTNHIALNDNNSFLVMTMNRYGITDRLIGLLYSNNVSTKNSVLRAVANILTGCDDYISKCIEYGVLPALHNMMKFYMHSTWTTQQSDGKLKELCWALSNITVGPREHVINAIETNFVPILVEVLRSSRSAAQEALWPISNMTSHCDAQIMYVLFENGVIQALCVFAKNRFYNQQYNRQNDKLLHVLLGSVEQILMVDDVNTHQFAIQFEEHGGVEFLEYLRGEDNISQAIYGQAVNIIKTHFDAENDEPAAMNNDTANIPNEQTKQFKFGLNANVNSYHRTNAQQSNQNIKTYSFQF